MPVPDHAERDREWVRRIGEGDRAAFEGLFRAYFDKLCAFAEQYAESPEAAEGFVQEAFLRLWKRRRTLEVEGSIRAYLYTSVRHLALDHVKHQRIVRRGREQAKHQQAPLPRTPEEEMDQRDLAKAIAEAIEQLPERGRLVFRLSRQHGLTYREIAETLDISESTVETHMRRSFKSLRQLLSEYLPVVLL